MILGLKKDMSHKVKVDYYDVSSMIRTLKDYVNCELLYVSNSENDDIVASLQCLFQLT